MVCIRHVIRKNEHPIYLLLSKAGKAKSHRQHVDTSKPSVTPNNELIMQKIQIYLRLFTLFFLTGLCTSAAGSAIAAEQIEKGELLARLHQGNHIALIRHALAPGFGDPDNFKLGDCTTQRNLSQQGREQAVRIGIKFRQSGITEADVYTSQWCRCRETAELLSLGNPQPLPPLNSFFQNFERKAQQTDALGKWLEKQPLEKPLILVTHQVNITAFSEVFPSSGEIVVMRRDDNGSFQAVGSIQTD